MTVFRPAITRKLLVPASVTLAILFGQSATAANQQIELVPDDSLFYFGTGKPVPVDHFFAMVPNIFDQETMTDLLPEMDKSESQQKFVKQLGDFFKDPAKVTEQWGLGDELQFSAYTVGLMPVFRIAGDAKQFETAILKVEAEHEIKFDKMTHKGIDIRIAAPEKKGSTTPKVVAPEASEIASAEASLAEAIAKGTAAREKLKTATAKLDLAKDAADGSGIAIAANEISDAAKDISTTQAAQADAEKHLAKLQQTKKDAENLITTGGKQGPGLIIAADGKDLTFAFSYNAYDPDMLDQLLGLEKPENSLAASGKLKQIRKDWNYGEEMVFFIDNQLIVDAITGGDSLAAKQVAMLASRDDKMQADLGPLAAEPCRAELRQMAANWPMMVSGNRAFEVTDTSMKVDGHFAMIFEHEEWRNTLKLLRGVIPVSQSSSEALMSFGVGVDVNSLPQLSGQLTDLLSQISYDCEILSPLNELGETDISAVSMGAMMFSGMARGIKGLSVNLYDVEIDAESKQMPVKNADAAIAIAAEDPATLVQTLRMLPQMSMLADLPLDGSAMSLNSLLPIPLPAGVELFAAVKGKNIVIYSGEQAAEFANRVGGNGQEAFVVSTVNTAKLITKVESMAAALPDSIKEDEEVDSVLKMLNAYPLGNIYYSLDFTDRGIEFESISDFERNEK